MMSAVPLVTAGDIAFWVTAPLMVLFALGFLVARRPVHSMVSMAGVMIGLAVLYAAQDAPFLFVVQIIVYTGAILMLFLFVVMLIGVDTQDSVVETIRGHRVAAILVAAGFGVLLIMGVGQFAVLGAPAGLEQANAGGNIEGLAQLVFEDYFLLFEVTAALLIIAPVGAIVLTHGDELKRRVSQWGMAQDRTRDYAEKGIHPGPLPNSGVFASHNSIAVPALLPDGSVAEKSLSQTLLDRGVSMDVDRLRRPTDVFQSHIDDSRAEIQGEK
jgi:NADH-quinone oxidoreductase subunit J